MNLTLTPAERQELAEILGSFGLLGSRLHQTKYSRRTAKAGNTTTPKGNAMSPQMQTSLQRSLAKVDAKYQQAAGAGFVLTLDHYASLPKVRIPLSGMGLTIDEMGVANDPKFKMLCHEYASDASRQLETGTSLAEYVATSWSDDCNAPLPPAAKGACEKLQKHFGAVPDRRTVLGWPA